jgi:putative ABC transport system permease protein
MLRLKNIVKTYEIGDTKVQALKGINLEFRKNEFVSILGPSGCGKTTMLNLIGGLDRYTDGDLKVNGKSTKDFNDRDWDAYRNFSIGFVFQNYNLITHQTVLSNVELALTLSGVSKAERRRRAEEVLQKVGLGDQLNKKPTQMSGGQMQRVSIARALINNPDILLADEPTGALDSETSIQIMELIKEIAKERLVIMVTHNPELAEQYSTRIVKLLDGNLLSDSNPYTTEEAAKEPKKKEKTPKKVSMSFLTALSLSLNNLLTKKARTFMTSFAGSIGLIGIALIMALSSGLNGYINKMQTDTLSSFPLSIEEQSFNMMTMMSAFMQVSNKKDDRVKEPDRIYSHDIMLDMMKAVSAQMDRNNLSEFKKQLDTQGSTASAIRDYSTDVKYGYNTSFIVYRSETDNIKQVQPTTMFQDMGVGGMGLDGGMSGTSAMSSASMWGEMIADTELLESQFDVIAGSWPQNWNEIVLVAENGEISDFVLYALGVRDIEEVSEIIKDMMLGKEVDENIDYSSSYSYDELLSLSFKLVLPTDYYEKVGSLWLDKSEDEEFLKEFIEKAPDIKVSGIISMKDHTQAAAISGSISYTNKLTEYVVNKINESAIAKAQLADEKTNVFNGRTFEEENRSFTMEEIIAQMPEAMQEQFQQMPEDKREEQIAQLMQRYAPSDSSYEANIQKLGIVNMDSPSSINIYPRDFASKEAIISLIDDYNKEQKADGKDENEITYTDIVASMIKTMQTIINIVSYVLIAFVSISLVVSSIMIGIITYISVLERTKEIGVLRSIGASKRDISLVFNAETLIVGFVAGVIGIGATYLISIPANAIILDLTKIPNICSLPPLYALVLIVLSMFLTLIAGLIPSKAAARKDPVEALRTE